MSITQLPGRKLFKNATLTLFFLLTLFTLGCESETSTINTTKIGIAMPDAADVFQQQLEEALIEHAEELGNGIELVIVDAGKSKPTQEAQINDFIKDKVDAIILVPVTSEQDYTDTLTQKAVNANLPLVYLNRHPPSTPEGTYYIGVKEYDLGVKQAEYMTTSISGGNVVILTGIFHHEAALKRTQGVRDYLKSHPNFQLIGEQSGMWNKLAAKVVMERWLKSDKRIHAVIANNDDMAIGAAKALASKGLLSHTLVIGIDATNAGMDAIESGALDATVDQSINEQAAMAIDKAIQLAKGREVEQYTWISGKLITQ